MKGMNRVYKSGEVAFRSGKTEEANPHNPGTHQHHVWQMGFLNAKIAAR